MEFLVETDLQSFPKSIDFNFTEIKSELEEKLVKYKNLVVTEDGIKAAKADKAKLNKLATANEDKRKEVKAICLAPYNDFEVKCKELVSLIKAPAVAIDTQVREFENIEKEKKYNELKAYFDENVKELSEIVDFDKILNPKWGNVTQKVDTLKYEIGDTIDRIREELATINEQFAEVPYKSAVISEYCKKYDLSKTLVYAAQLKKDAEIQERAVSRNSEPEKIEASQKTTQTVIAGIENAVPQEPTGSVSFTVTCTRSQLIELRNYMKKNAIAFKVIK